MIGLARVEYYGVVYTGDDKRRGKYGYGSFRCIGAAVYISCYNRVIDACNRVGNITSSKRILQVNGWVPMVGGSRIAAGCGVNYAIAWANKGGGWINGNCRLWVNYYLY